MPNTGHYWDKCEVEALIDAYKERKPYQSVRDVCRAFVTGRGLTLATAESKIRDLIVTGKINTGVIKESTYPIYDEPLEMRGDALVLGDVEFPFHHSEFLNGCLEVAGLWGIRQLILAGDVLHFDSLSSFEPSWNKEVSGGITADAEMELRKIAVKLPKGRRAEMEAVIDKVGRLEEHDGASTEFAIARRNLQRLADSFDVIDFIIGNHEGRYLRAMDTPLVPSEILRALEAGQPKWRIAPFYFSTLISGGEKFRITHPKNSAKGASRNLASKFHQHILMAHNHHFMITSDKSGKYLCAEIGCCVDENRLPYAAQRDNSSDMHILGAAIVRNGKAWFLNKFTDWDVLRKL